MEACLLENIVNEYTAIAERRGIPLAFFSNSYLLARLVCLFRGGNGLFIDFRWKTGDRLIVNVVYHRSIPDGDVRRAVGTREFARSEIDREHAREILRMSGDAVIMAADFDCLCKLIGEMIRGEKIS